MKNDARCIKNEEKIIKIFIQMILEIIFKSITVNELTEKAKMNRKTFYSHYSTIEDLIKKLEIQYFEEYIKFIDELNIFRDYKKIIKMFYLFHVQKDEFMDKLTYDSNYEYIKNQMIKKVKESYINSSISIDLNKYKLNIASITIY